MKKITLSLVATVALCCSNYIYSASWNGFYFGGNAGYWKSQNNDITTTGSASYINQTYVQGASNIANALAQVATNSFSLHPNGFIGGGQVGYNYLFSKGFLFGLNADLDGLTNSKNTYNLQKTVNLADFNENYAGSLSVKQTINYLGTVHARLGYLLYPTFLVYGTGGFAYGCVTLNSTWTAQESLGPGDFPGINTQNTASKTLAGWTAGGGIEWLFLPKWSTSLEYTYYNLNDLNTSTNLAQINQTASPAAVWGSANANTALAVSVGTIRLGINYHFA